MDAVWTLLDAKNRLSAVVDAAARGEPPGGGHLRRHTTSGVSKPTVLERCQTTPSSWRLRRPTVLRE